MQSRRKLYITLLVMFGFVSFAFIAPTQVVHGAAGTVGGVETGSNLKSNLGFWLKLYGVTEGAEYILVPSVTTMGFSNSTLTAGSSTTYAGSYMFTATGEITIDLYGYDSTTGVATGAVLGSWQIRVTNIGDSIIGPDLFTDLISFFLPIIIVMTIVLAFRFRDRIRQFSKRD